MTRHVYSRRCVKQLWVDEFFGMWYVWYVVYIYIYIYHIYVYNKQYLQNSAAYRLFSLLLLACCSLAATFGCLCKVDWCQSPSVPVGKFDLESNGWDVPAQQWKETCVRFPSAGPEEEFKGVSACPSFVCQLSCLCQQRLINPVLHLQCVFRKLQLAIMRLHKTYEYAMNDMVRRRLPWIFIGFPTSTRPQEVFASNVGTHWGFTIWKGLMPWESWESWKCRYISPSILIVIFQGETSEFSQAVPIVGSRLFNVFIHLWMQLHQWQQQQQQSSWVIYASVCSVRDKTGHCVHARWCRGFCGHWCFAINGCGIFQLSCGECWHQTSAGFCVGPVL